MLRLFSEKGIHTYETADSLWEFPEVLEVTLEDEFITVPTSALPRSYDIN